MKCVEHQFCNECSALVLVVFFADWCNCNELDALLFSLAGNAGLLSRSRSLLSATRGQPQPRWQSYYCHILHQPGVEFTGVKLSVLEQHTCVCMEFEVPSFCSSRDKNCSRI